MRHSQEPRTIKTSLMLGGLGVISLLCYLASNFLIPQSPANMANSRAVLIHRLPLWSGIVGLPLPVPKTSLAVVTKLMAMVILTLACYPLALWVSRRTSANPITLSIVLGFAVLFFLTSALSLPNFSHDLYSYILHTRVFNIYQANPYVVPAATFTNDPYLQFADPSWIQLVTPYGPTWT